MSDTLLYWEDFPIGETVEFGETAVTAEAIVAFAREFDPQPFHLDAEAAARSVLGGLSASGWHSCAMMMRMICDGFLLRAASLGASGIEEVRWQKAVRAGDTLRLVRETLDRRASKSNPVLGLTQFKIALRNQRGETAVTCRYWARFARRTKD